MTDTDLKTLTTRAAEAEAALKKAEAEAKAIKATLKAARPSQMNIIRQAVIADEKITDDALLASLHARGYPNAKKAIVSSYRSDALAFLRLLRTMGKLPEQQAAPEPASQEASEPAATAESAPQKKSRRH